MFKKRFFPLTVLIIAMLLFSISGWLRFGQALAQWNWLEQLGIQPGPLYLAASGALWGALALASAVGLWLRRLWAVRLSQITTLVIALSYWADRLLVVQPNGSNYNLLFSAILTLFGVVFSLTTLSLVEPIGQEG